MSKAKYLYAILNDIFVIHKTWFFQLPYNKII